MKFRDHKYVWTHPFTATRHQWSLRGPRGGIHLSVQIMDDEEKYPDPACGLEFHHSYDPTGGNEAPHHIDCWLIGNPCWHDGTSLYAFETVWPHVKLLMPNNKEIFSYLETLYIDHFEAEQ